jgi:hypothetical protein
MKLGIPKFPIKPSAFKDINTYNVMQNKLFELISTVKNVIKNLTIMLPENIKVQQRITNKELMFCEAKT